MKGPSLRSLWRSAREVHVVGAAVKVADRLWWYRSIAGSPLVDPGFYAAQRGRRTTSRRAAILHYIFFGFRKGLSLNPLFDEIYAGGSLPEVFRVPALYAYLVSDRPTVSVHPWWDAVSHGREARDVDDAALEAVWENRDDAVLELTAAHRSRSVSVLEFRSWAIEAASEWARHDFRGVPATRPGSARASVIGMVQQRDRRYARRLTQLARASQAGMEPVAVLIQPDASQWISARVLTNVDPAVRVTGRRSAATWAQAVSGAVAETHGDVLAVLDARSEMDDADLERMITQAGRGDAVIPCGRAFDGTLVGVGAACIDAPLPWPILQHHPVEDLAGLGDEVVEVPLLTGRTFAVPRLLFNEPTAWDLSLVNAGELEVFSLELRRRNPSVRFVADPRIRPVQDEPERAFSARRPARFVAAVKRRPSVRDGDRAKHLIELAGFDLEGWRADRTGGPTPILRWRRPSTRALRWAIKICAPAGRRGEVWGDLHFAQGLAAALRRLGHTVVIDAFDARLRSTTYLDDVSLVVRGPYRIDPPPTGVSMQWIISHPDQITRREVAQFHAVFAASVSWSRMVSSKWGVSVEPLLECTDTDKFTPQGLPRGDDIVFVGTARGIPRPSVVAPLGAGIPVRVYGPDWRPFIPASAIVATSIPNSELPGRYETASVVLNDQWPAMRRMGFIAMRPFDAVAVGARVISEHVEGIEPIFRGAVVTYDDEADLVGLLRRDPDELFPSDERLDEIAAYVRAEHSFDARARVLDGAARGHLDSRSRAGLIQDRG